MKKAIRTIETDADDLVLALEDDTDYYDVDDYPSSVVRKQSREKQIKREIKRNKKYQEY